MRRCRQCRISAVEYRQGSNADSAARQPLQMQPAHRVRVVDCGNQRLARATRCRDDQRGAKPARADQSSQSIGVLPGFGFASEQHIALAAIWAIVDQHPAILRSEQFCQLAHSARVSGEPPARCDSHGAAARSDDVIGQRGAAYLSPRHSAAPLPACADRL